MYRDRGDHLTHEEATLTPFATVGVTDSLAAMMCDVLKLDFDPLDVPRDRFIVGGAA